jgi:hypothetical protein
LLPLPLPLNLLLPVRRHGLAAVLHVPTDGPRLGREHADDLQRLNAIVDVESGISLAHRLLAGLNVGRDQLLEKLLAARPQPVVLGQLVQQADHDQFPAAVLEVALLEVLDPVVAVPEEFLGLVLRRVLGVLHLLLGGRRLRRKPVCFRLGQASPSRAA